MQQTDKYKLNLIEKTDTFSPDPLNENMQKVEAAITAEAAARTSADAAEAKTRADAIADLDRRLKVFEVRRMATGVYYASENLVIDVGFKPKLVFIHACTHYYSGFLVPEDHLAGSTQYGKLTDSGFEPGTYLTQNILNSSYIGNYIYFAFG